MNIAHYTKRAFQEITNMVTSDESATLKAAFLDEIISKCEELKTQVAAADQERKNTMLAMLNSGEEYVPPGQSPSQPSAETTVGPAPSTPDTPAPGDFPVQDGTPPPPPSEV